MMNVWRDLHEGVAVHTVISLCISELYDPEDWVRRAVRILEEHTKAPFPATIKDDLRDLAEGELERIRRGQHYEVYAQGIEAALRICEPGQDFDQVWAAFLAAMHFPYPSCELLDMSRQEYGQWMEDYRCRFERVASRPDLVRQLNAELATVESEPPSTMNEILQLANGGIAIQPISPDAVRFGTWLRRHIWGAQLFRRFLEAADVDLDSISGFDEYEQIFADDRSADFRIPSYHYAPRIDNKGRIFVSDEQLRKPVMRRFISSYEVWRTRRLLRWLNKHFGGLPEAA